MCDAMRLVAGRRLDSSAGQARSRASSGATPRATTRPGSHGSQASSYHSFRDKERHQEPGLTSYTPASPTVSLCPRSASYPVQSFVELLSAPFVSDLH